MTSKKEKTTTSVNIWANIDFQTVKNRIKVINDKIEATLLKYKSQEDYRSENKEENKK